MRVGDEPGTAFTLKIHETWVEYADPHASDGPPPVGGALALKLLRAILLGSRRDDHR
jgi:hypothetical protein